MKRIFLLSALALTIFACNKDKQENIDKLIESKNLKSIKERRAQVQSDLIKLDEAIATMDTTKSAEALVSVATLKDTVFNHYLEIQGSVNTKQNILVQPEFRGT